MSKNKHVRADSTNEHREHVWLFVEIDRPRSIWENYIYFNPKANQENFDDDFASFGLGKSTCVPIIGFLTRFSNAFMGPCEIC